MTQISKFILLMIRNFLTLRTSSFEAIFIAFCIVPKSGVNTALAAAAQQEATIVDNKALVASATHQALLIPGFDNGPGQNGLVAAAMAASSTGSSAVRPPWAESPRTSTTPQMLDFHPHPQASHFSTFLGRLFAGGKRGCAGHAHCHGHRPQRQPAPGGSSTGGQRK